MSNVLAASVVKQNMETPGENSVYEAESGCRSGYAN